MFILFPLWPSHISHPNSGAGCLLLIPIGSKVSTFFSHPFYFQLITTYAAPNSSINIPLQCFYSSSFKLHLNSWFHYILLPLSPLPPFYSCECVKKLKMEKPISHFTVTLLFLLFNQSLAIPGTHNILDLGAKPDGKTDSSKSLLSAWAAACGSPKPATIFVPKGRYFVKQAQFLGPCRNRAISFRIDGTLVAPSDYKLIGNADFWLQFQWVDGVFIRGGILDGQGTDLWGCKASGRKCPSGAAVSQNDRIAPSPFQFLSSLFTNCLGVSGEVGSLCNVHSIGL